MVKKRRSSSDTEFRFDIPASPDKACEAQQGAPDSPGSVFLRWVLPAVCLSSVCLSGFCPLTGPPERALASFPGVAVCQGGRERSLGLGARVLKGCLAKDVSSRTDRPFPLLGEKHWAVCVRTSESGSQLASLPLPPLLTPLRFLGSEARTEPNTFLGCPNCRPYYSNSND